jgi:hypothetical protein
MSRIIKVNAEQSAPYSSSNNIVDFLLEPAQYDMTRSFVNLQIETTQAIPDSGAGGARVNVSGGVCSYYFKHNGSDNMAFNATLVKHCRLEADGQKLEDLQRNDIRIQQQLTYAKNMDDIKGDEYMSLMRPTDHANRRSALGLELKSLGSSSSVAGLVNVMIPVSHLFNLGKYKLCPLNKKENIKMHLELNPDLIECLGAITQEYSAAAGDVAIADAQFGAGVYREFANITATAAGQTVTEITTTHRFKSLVDSPYYVGMPLHMGGNLNGAGEAALAYAYITEITQNTNGTLVLKLSNSIATLAAINDTLITIRAFGVNVTMDFSITGAELSLVQLPTVPVDKFEYTTYEHEQDFGGERADFSRQYYLPAECSNVYICHPAFDLFCLQQQVARVNPGPVNITSTISSYRLRCDQEDLTDREIVYKTPLYYDVASSVLARSSIPLKNSLDLLPNTAEANDAHPTEGATKNTILMGGAVPMTPDRKTLDIMINYATGANTTGCQNLHIYKEVSRML